MIVLGTTLSPWDWASEHIQLIGWPTLVYLAWRVSRFITKKEYIASEEKIKLDETHQIVKDAKLDEVHQIVKDTQKSLSDIVQEWKQENSEFKKMVGSLVQLQQDFHDHTVKDEFSFKTIERSLEEIKQAVQA